MVLKLGISGFGRTGRMTLWRSLERPNPEIEVTGVNDPFLKPAQMAYMLRNDSVHGHFPGEVTHSNDHLVIRCKGEPQERRIRVFMETNPAKIDWASTGVEIVIDCSGCFTTTEKALPHVTGGGAKKVIISAPGKDATPMFVVGVNHQSYTRDMVVVSNASCTTNCLAPLAKVINDKFGIVEGLMTTIHAITANQNACDGPAKGGKDWRAGRAASINIIPASTGAAHAVGMVIPELKGKLTGMAFRVPTANVSVVDLTVRLERGTTYMQVVNAIKEASQTNMKHIMGWTEDALVSSDFIHDDRSCVFDVQAGVMLSPNFVKLVGWYDNEYAYSCRMLDLAEHMHKVDLRSYDYSEDAQWEDADATNLELNPNPKP